MEERIDFAKELNRLNEIVSAIQEQDLPLEKAVSLYEEGNKIIATLKDELAKAEAKVEQIIEVNKK